jgi:Putative prokaryotic signal transducing protein
VATTRLTTVRGEVEAEMLCGMLRSFGIKCASGLSATEAAEGFVVNPPNDVFVDETDLPRAREILADYEGSRASDEDAG